MIQRDRMGRALGSFTNKEGSPDEAFVNSMRTGRVRVPDDKVVPRTAKVVFVQRLLLSGGIECRRIIMRSGSVVSLVLSYGKSLRGSVIGQ